MKITFDVECTPQEARAFFGLPDLQPLHDVYLDRMKATMADGVNPAEWEKLMRTWAPGIAGNYEQWQKLFLSGLGAGLGSGGLAAAPKPPKA
ncbi:DUF6489 family protein [Sandarakinorhabdus sp.]|uniref:DUF6489 family protein n=1 Tax=Sandarakinorhabdus sp. TaxID=1916663 RepID=UPI00333F68D3